MQTPSEHQEQSALFRWAHLQECVYPELALLHATPNGGDRHPVVAAKLKAEGVRRGFPDVSLHVARGGYHALHIELKKMKGGRVTHEQREWLEMLNAAGCRAVVCRGFVEAQKEILHYLCLPAQ